MIRRLAADFFDAAVLDHRAFGRAEVRSQQPVLRHQRFSATKAKTFLTDGARLDP
jgi:hypothetical protein